MIKIFLIVVYTIMLVSCATAGEVKTENNYYYLDASVFNFGNKGATADALNHAITLSKEYCSKKIPGGKSKIIRVVELVEGSHGGKVRLYFDCTR